MLRILLAYAIFTFILLVIALKINSASLACLSFLVFLNISFITLNILSNDAKQISYLKVWKYSIINFNIFTVIFSSGVLIFKIINGMLNIHTYFVFFLIVLPLLLFSFNWIVSSLLQNSVQFNVSLHSLNYLKAISYFSIALLITGSLIVAFNWDGFDWMLSTIITVFYLFQLSKIVRQKLNLE